MDTDKEHCQNGKKPGNASRGAPTIVKLPVELPQGELEIYEKLFMKTLAIRISKLQVILAGVISVCQVLTSCMMRYSSSLEGSGAGIWAPLFTVSAAACIYWTCKRLTYMRLHFSMALHLVSVFAMMFLLIFVLGDSIPSARHRLYSRYLTPDLKNDFRYDYHTYNYSYTSDMQRKSTAQPAIRYYSREYGPIGLTLAAMMFYVIISIAGLVELVLSMAMASMSCRAMCVGRKRIEDRILAMELATHQDIEAGLTVEGKNKAKDLRAETALPPSYHKITLGSADGVSVA